MWICRPCQADLEQTNGSRGDKNLGEDPTKYCTGIRNGLHTGTMPLNKKLQDRMDRHAMEKGARKGHFGEEAWTNMCIDGLECVSSGCQVIGFFVGYSGYNANKSAMTPSRIKQYIHHFDIGQMPAMMKSKTFEC